MNLCYFVSHHLPGEPPDILIADNKPLSSVMLEADHGLMGQEEHAHTTCWVCVLSCFLLACLYVGSLYVWRSSLQRYSYSHL